MSEGAGASSKMPDPRVPSLSAPPARRRILVKSESVDSSGRLRRAEEEIRSGVSGDVLCRQRHRDIRCSSSPAGSRAARFKQPLTRTDSAAAAHAHVCDVIDQSRLPRRIAESIQQSEPRGTHGKPPINVQLVDPGARTNTSKQLKFARIVHKKMASIRKGMQSMDTGASAGGSTWFASCPNLAEDELFLQQGCMKPLVRPTRSAHSNLCNTSSSPTDSSKCSSPQLLTVPSIFTTSFTHSRAQSPQDNTALVNSLGGYRHSAPELGQDTVRRPQKHTLKKSISDNPPRRLLPETVPPLRRTSAGDSGSGELVDNLSKYRSEAKVWRVSDGIFIGNLESAYNRRMLCRLGIASLVDLSSVPPDDVPASKKNDIPCACSSPQTHQPAAFRINVCESDLEDLQSYFPQINKFIEGARERDKNVLVFCYTGNNLSVLAVVQFLMRMRNLNFRKAYSRVMKGRSDIELNPDYMALLQSLDKELYSEPEDIIQLVNGKSTESRSIFLPKEAWTC